MLAMSEIEKHIKDEILQYIALLAAEIDKHNTLEWLEQVMIDLQDLPK